MKYKVSELEGALLDAAVANAQGWEWHVTADRSTCYAAGGPFVCGDAYRPSTNADDGFEIIERERIGTSCDKSAGPSDPADDGSGFFWTAEVGPGAFNDDGETRTSAFGPTLLIAAMRAYVASKFGEEVEL